MYEQPMGPEEAYAALQDEERREVKEEEEMLKEDAYHEVEQEVAENHALDGRI